eukprot:scaffold748_cov251-Pinguiococcus_pyrenoidosus.AAC.26
MAGKNIAVALHPGNVMTEAVAPRCLSTCQLILSTTCPIEVTRNMPAWMQWGHFLIRPLLMTILKRPPMGAYTSVYAACAPLDDQVSMLLAAQRSMKSEEETSPHRCRASNSVPGAGGVPGSLQAGADEPTGKRRCEYCICRALTSFPVSRTQLLHPPLSPLETGLGGVALDGE